MVDKKTISILCREINKETGDITSYLVKRDIDNHEALVLKLRSRLNPELEYFATLMEPEGEDFEDALSLLKERKVDCDALKEYGVIRL